MARMLMELLRARWELGHTVKMPVADIKQAGVCLLLSWERLWMAAKKQAQKEVPETGCVTAGQMTSFMSLDSIGCLSHMLLTGARY